MIPQTCVDGRCDAARQRGMKYVLHFVSVTQEGLEFLDEARSIWELDAMKRGWWQRDFILEKEIDLFPDETPLEETRRKRRQMKNFHGRKQ